MSTSLFIGPAVIPFDMDSGRFLLQFAFVAAAWLALRWALRGFHLTAFVWLPATLAHELAHLLVGLVVRARPSEFSIWPRRVPGANRYVLGHVGFRALNWWKKLPVATAPLWLLLPLTLFLVQRSLRDGQGLPLTALYFALAVQSMEGAWPSSEDWALARHTIYALLALIFGALAFCLAATTAASRLVS